MKTTNAGCNVNSDRVVTTQTTPNILVINICRVWYEAIEGANRILRPYGKRTSFEEYLETDYQNYACMSDEELVDYWKWMKRQGYLKKCSTTSANRTRKKPAKVIQLRSRSASAPEKTASQQQKP